MKRPLFAAVVLLGALLVPGTAAAAPLNLTQHVNPFIGTDDSNSPNPVPGGAGGSTYPGATVPFGGVQFSPDTPNGSPSGYRYSDSTVEEFSLTHFNGAGCANNEDLGILPVTGALGTSPGTGWTGYASAYTKTNEQAAPGYYRTRLDRYSTDVELTATTRAGFAKLTYPASTTSRVLINTSRSATGNRSGSVSLAGDTVTGYVTAGGFCGSSKTYRIYFALKADRTPTGSGTWNGGTVTAGSTSTSGVNTGAYLTFDTSTNRTVQVKVAVSYVSVANASANLAAEIAGFDFAGTRTAADTAWNTVLNKVQATGGTAADQQKFYTALYHVFQNPNISSDVNGQYFGFDNVVHTASHPVYQNYSGWDIYRSWAALIAFVAPAEASDIAKSMVLDGQQGGLLPKWSQQTNEDFVMTGDPGPIIVGSMYAFGARDFDTAAALALMDKSSNGGTAQGGAIRGRQSTYVNQHFINGESSDSLEYSASDFAVAQFARSQGDTAKYNTYMTRAQWWRNVYNAESGYVHTRNSDGSWPWPLDPASGSNFTEGNASQYTWMVPYNLGGLVNLMGGPAQAVRRLDHHFTELNGGLTRPYFYIGNEPEHNVPWAYNFARHPAGTATAVRRVMAESFTTGPGGLPGNDDLGATSAWYVWAALGMYPVTPGADTLALHGPTFPSVLIQRAAGNVTLTATGTGSHVQGLTVNGAATSRNYVRYPDLAAGGTVNYTMGGTAGSWGTGAGDVPPSFDDGATPVPAAPALGTNLALGRAATSSATCSATETAGRAVDGSLANNSKWCSSASGAFLQVDLGAAVNVGQFVLEHAGLGGETTGWNTGGYTVATSTDGTTWTTAATVTGSRASRTYHSVAGRTARYVRLSVTTPTNNGNTAARIYEFGVYAPGAVNLALNRPATADSSCNANEGPAKAVNGSVGGGNTDKWCSAGAAKWWQVDLGSTVPVGNVTVRHAGAGGESATWNTRDFDVQVSADGVGWTTVATVRGNTADVSSHPVSGSGRYVRVNVVTPTQTSDAAARIYEVEVYA
ncbi:GH92 family glycosyl hydrolase [Longispora urticae]